MDNQQPSINKSFYQRPKQGYGFIYKYTSPSNLSYIGQTITSPHLRAKVSSSGIGYKKCSIFWKAIQKYGWNNFTFEILEEVKVEKLNEREEFYINKYNTVTPHGYNLTFGRETGKKREVYVYSAQNGEFLEHYKSLTEASEQTGVPIETISAILSTKNNRKIAHNLTFLDHYVEEFDINSLIRKNYRKVYVYDRYGNYLSEFVSISQASKQLKIGQGSIVKCLNGTSLHASYYQFKKERFDKIDEISKNSKTPISVCQIDPNSQKIIAIFPSYAAAGRAVGLSSGGGIKRVVMRGKGLSGGYFWKINEGSTTTCLKKPIEPVRDSVEVKDEADEDIV